jgi:hypothetical protein
MYRRGDRVCFINIPDFKGVVVEVDERFIRVQWDHDRKANREKGTWVKQGSVCHEKGYSLYLQHP